RDAPVVTAAGGAARVLLERLDVQAGAGERAHDLPEPPQPLRVARLAEVALAPAQEPVHALGDRMVVEEKQLPARPQRRRDPARPPVQVGKPPDHALAGVDEVEAAASQLRRQLLRLALDPED